MTELTPAGINILALDGGGVSVLSELLIVKELMARIAGRSPHEAPPRPHEYFQLIGGTGTGGLMAILLGRLKLGIDEAIDCWLDVMRTVFTRKKLRESEGAFKATLLEQVIIRIVAKYDESDENMIKAGDDEHCKVVVYALNGDAIRAGIPTSIRTYRAHSNQGPQCTIVDAVRATMASPLIFKPKTILEGGVAQTYVGGNLSANNPTPHLLNEVQPGQSVASVISIGAGQLHSARLTNQWGREQKLSKRLAKTLKAMAEDCEKTSEEMSRRFEGQEGYYRFNVDQGMQDLDQHNPDRRQVGDAQAHTQQYLRLREPDTKMSKAVTRVMDATRTMINGENAISTNNSSSSPYTGVTEYTSEPGGLPSRITDPQERGDPRRIESAPNVGAQERQIERLMSLGVPGRAPQASEPQRLPPISLTN